MNRTFHRVSWRRKCQQIVSLCRLTSRLPPDAAEKILRGSVHKPSQGKESRRRPRRLCIVLILAARTTSDSDARSWSASLWRQQSASTLFRLLQSGVDNVTRGMDNVQQTSPSTINRYIPGTKRDKSPR